MNNNKIKQIVDEAKKVLPCVWPLKSFIATNPLWDLTDKPFVAAIGEMSQYVDVSAGQTVADYHAYYVNGKYTSADIVHAASLVMKWDQADSLQFSRHIFRDDMIHSLMMFEEANAAAALPATLVIEQIAANHDADLLRLMKKDIHAFYARYLSKKQYSSLLAAWCQENDCNEPIATHYIAQRFEKLGLDETSAIYYTRKLLSSTIGYAGLVKWLESRPDNPLFQSDACLVEMIAVWLLYEEQIEKRYPQFVFTPALTGSLNDAFKPLPATFSFGLSSHINPSLADIKMVLHTAWELAYINGIEKQLHPVIMTANAANPDAQFVFCIDTRSEGIRRHLERTGNIKTYGFAGFYGLPIQSDHSTGKSKLQCPAICEPSLKVSTYTINSAVQQASHSITNTMVAAKSNGAAALDLYDVVGFWHAPAIALRNLAPSLYQRMINRFTKPTEYLRVPVNDELDKTMVANQIAGVLKAIGLTTDFAKYVVICAHQAQTENNPYHASLECGACGGNSGMINAKTFCTYANRKVVREALRDAGIHIPDDTTFVAACHDTTNDVLSFDDACSASKSSQFEHINKMILSACEKLRNEKLSDSLMPLYSDNAASWCELIPELGLVNNSCMIIGPRAYTQQVNLQRRAFLHSYDPVGDTDGAILRGIMLAPMIVAHWINMQYFFSTTSPTTYGSGNKALHNLLGDIGVLEGNGGDLRIGLPMQSVSYQSVLLHEPRRLAVFICAPRARVDAIIAEEPVLQNLVNNNWIHLRVIEPVE